MALPLTSLSALTDRWLAAALVCCAVAGRAGAQCTLTCPPGAASEPEACGAAANDGCNLATPTYAQVYCGTTVCATSWAQNGDRDTDWYTFNVTDPDGDGIAQVNATVASEFPATFYVLNNDCSNILAFGQGESDSCQPTTISACVTAPGTYRVFVAPGTADGAIFDGIPCGGDNAYWIRVECDDTCSPPSNDACTGAIDIGDGGSFFSTVTATTDGPPHALCDTNTGDTQVHNDVWFRYTASCTGDVIVESCNSASFDTRIAIYDGCVCPVTEADLLMCNDEMSGCDSGTSALFAPVMAGQCYLIRVGGFNGGTGLGTIRVECYPDGLCPDTGDCSIANGSPSCSDPACCATVCDIDQFCCLVDWDDLCAQEAADLCTGESAEACCLPDDSCAQVTPTDCLATSGTAQGAGTTCATITCGAPDTEACCIAEGVCINAIPADCVGYGGSPQGPGTVCGGSLTCFSEACCLPDESCAEITRDECLAVGGIANGAGTTCASTACAAAPPCPSDIAPTAAADGTVDVTDLLNLLANWGTCPSPCPQDIVADGEIDVLDLLSLLADWGPCP